MPQHIPQHWLWIGFNAVILALLFLDLVMFHRQTRAITLRQALLWTGFWVLLGLGMNLAIYYHMGPDDAMEFLAAYLLEESLSVDNLFVFLLIFSYFRVPPEYQHRALFLGVLGALIMRAIVIVAGISLVERFSWVLYIFGSILIYSGFKMMGSDDEDIDPDQNPIVKQVRKFFPVTKDYHGTRLFTRIDGVKHATPLLIVLVAIETTDLVFALDSIPAVFGVTQDHFIVYSSNVMAILGLRALYFALAGLMGLFRFLRFGLSAILIFIGAKMLLARFFEIPTMVALGVIAVVLIGSVALSLAFPAPKEEPAEGEGGSD